MAYVPDYNSQHRQTRVGGLLQGLFKVDPPLLMALLALSGLGMVVLYSASGQDLAIVTRQLIRLSMAAGVMLVLAQVPARHLAAWSPWLYLLGLLMLTLVLVIGDVGKGAQRWLDLGFFRFQPSELMKLALPMMLARYLGERPLPPSGWNLTLALLLILTPCLMIATQPDLGTALLVGASGCMVVFLAGIRWRVLGISLLLGAALTPLLWYFMRDYQRQRVLTFLNPESDPLGSGYHIIQSKIAIGSGGPYGKGWLNGTQAQLDFLPERSTDFVFAVFGEEFGMLGGVALLVMYFFITLRGLVIAVRAQECYERLLAGGLSLTFFVYLFVNVGMVTGLLPVVGVPLPLVSYGGTSMVTLMAGFGILMSIHSHKRLLSG